MFPFYLVFLLSELGKAIHALGKFILEKLVIVRRLAQATRAREPFRVAQLPSRLRGCLLRHPRIKSGDRGRFFSRCERAAGAASETPWIARKWRHKGLKRLNPRPEKGYISLTPHDHHIECESSGIERSRTGAPDSRSLELRLERIKRESKVRLDFLKYLY